MRGRGGRDGEDLRGTWKGCGGWWVGVHLVVCFSCDSLIFCPCFAGLFVGDVWWFSNLLLRAFLKRRIHVFPFGVFVLSLVGGGLAGHVPRAEFAYHNCDGKFSNATRVD